MAIDFFCPHWGSEKLPFQQFLLRVKNAGYSGVEMSLPLEKERRNEVVSAISDFGLKLICQHWETVDKDFQIHSDNFRERLINLASAKPLFINSQTGKDYYSFEQNCSLINSAQRLSDETGVPIFHESHRGKFSFAAHITEKYLDLLPDLQLTLDISHWCCVAARMLDDQQEAVAKAIQRTRHIHARVGFTQGPQIMDPRAPEWDKIVDQHIAWWQQALDVNNALGHPITITTEFGPFPYLQHFPYTNLPIYHQWEVNVYMMNTLRSRLH
jgi:sugar phosphate isomerase/epimerase